MIICSSSVSMAGRPACICHIYCGAEHRSGGTGDGTGRAGTGPVETDAGRCCASEDRLAGAQRVSTQHAHVCPVPVAVQSGITSAVVLGVSPLTMVDWTNLIRFVFAVDTWRQQEGSTTPGRRAPYEIDKSYFYSRKYHRVRIVTGLWVCS